MPLQDIVAGRLELPVQGFPRSQIIDLTRFQVSDDFFSYRKMFYVFSARKDFFENFSSHYS